MSSAAVFQAQERVNSGTGAARAVRNEQMVPGIIYGDQKEPQKISVDLKSLLSATEVPGFFSKVFTLSINQTQQQVIAKDVQYHPVTDVPIHIDFQRVNKDSKIHISVPISFINEDKSPGLKRGGKLNIVVHSLNIICSPHAVPEKFTVDLSGFESGHSISLDVLELSSEIKVAHAARDNVLATIVGAKTTEEAAS